MTSCAELADYEWLTGPQAAELLGDLAGRSEPLHTTTTRLRREFSPVRAHLLLEQIDLRRRAAAKFERAAEMFFTRLGLEQATDQWVAAYKARRFAGHGPIADLCCGIDGDLLALAEQGPVVGLDRDPIATCLAAASARAILSAVIASRVEMLTTEVETSDACGLAAWHMDPDRRPTDSRTSTLAWSSPNGDTIHRLLAAVASAAIKLAPAAEVPAEWTERCELEWISRDRQCRQLVAWHGELAETPGHSRATVLTNHGHPARTVIGPPDQHVPTAGQLDRFLLEPDPAVLASHLAGALAAEHNLSAVAPGIAYFTSATAIADPALACFEVDEIYPLDLRQLRRHLCGRNIGSLEIKTRGVDHDPETVRRQLQLAGDEAATLFLTKLNGKHAAILAQRIGQDQSAASPTPDTRNLMPSHAACL